MRLINRGIRLGRKFRLGALAASAITLLAIGGEPGVVQAAGPNDCPCKSQGYYKTHDFCDLLGTGLSFGLYGYTGAISPDARYGQFYNSIAFLGQRGLKLGDFAYTCDQLVAILSMPDQGNGALILAKQLIAAKLNVLAGCPAPPEVLEAIKEADMILWASTIGFWNDWGPRMLPPVGNAFIPTNYVDASMPPMIISLQAVKDILEAYNLCRLD